MVYPCQPMACHLDRLVKISHIRSATSATRLTRFSDRQTHPPNVLIQWLQFPFPHNNPEQLYLGIGVFDKWLTPQPPAPQRISDFQCDDQGCLAPPPFSSFRSFSPPPFIFIARTVATSTTARRQASFTTFYVKDFSAPRSAPNPASVTT